MTTPRHRLDLAPGFRPLVEVGDRVDVDRVVARTRRAVGTVSVSVARRLRVGPSAAAALMLVQPGDEVEAGEPLARASDGREAPSPVSGFLLWYSPAAGTAVVAILGPEALVTAAVEGRVASIDVRGIELDVDAGAIDGIDGSGDPVHGELTVAVDAPGDELRPGHVDARDAGRILVSGSRVSSETLSRARAMGVAGIVVGGVLEKELRDFLAAEDRRRAAAVAVGRRNETDGVHDAARGVAARRSRATASTSFGLLVLEGYGRAAIDGALFEWFRAHDGRRATLLGARRRLYVYGARPAPARRVPALPGDRVVALRRPHQGSDGELVGVVPRLRIAPSGIAVRTAIVRMAQGGFAAVPLSNVEAVDVPRDPGVSTPSGDLVRRTER